MRTLAHLFENNRQWVESMNAEDPNFFHDSAIGQQPHYLWIGCADSRIPVNHIVGVKPGEIFVHRNIANVVLTTDLNALSVIQYAIEVLKVQDVIICGHYGCGGVRAAMDDVQLGLIDNWLRPVQDIIIQHRDLLAPISDPDVRHDRLCELNVIAQVMSVIRTTIVQHAWQRGQRLNIHGWLYNIRNGYLQDLQATITNPTEVASVYEHAVNLVREKVMATV